MSPAPGDGQGGERRVSGASGPGASGPRGNGRRAGGQQNIATAITDVSERVAVLVREEVELAKAEVAEKASKLAKGAVVGVAAGIFVVTALFFVLIGFAWLLYYVLPVPAFAYFWGFFAMAAILLVLAVLAGLIAARVVKKSAPPVPTMAIEEARLIRETMSAGSEHGGSHGAVGPPLTGTPASTPPPVYVAAPLGGGPGGPIGGAGPVGDAPAADAFQAQDPSGGEDS